jgi:tetratricopeptide (TPR) repeat protein
MSEETFKQALRRLRGQTSLRGLARRANCSKSYIWDLEQGNRQPSPSVVRALDAALWARGTLVSLAEPADEPGASHPPEAVTAGGRVCACGDVPVPAPEVGQDETAWRTLEEILGWWDEMLRRNFLIGGSAMAVAAAPSGAGARPEAGGRELLDAHRELRAVYGRLDNLHGPATVYTQAAEQHRQLLDWHDQASSATERVQIGEVAADTGDFMGWLAYDLGRYREAAGWYRQAAALAADIGDIDQCAYTLGQMSRTLAECGQHPAALRFADAAVSIAGTAAHPAIRSFIRAVRANHHASLGDAQATHADLDAAAALLNRADDGHVPHYVGYHDAGDLQKWTGHALVRLSAADPALLATGRAAIEAAWSAWPPTHIRGSAEVLATHARAELASHEVEHAAQLTLQAFTVAATTGSVRNLRWVSALRAEFSPYRNTRAVRQLNERLLDGPIGPV